MTKLGEWSVDLQTLSIDFDKLITVLIFLYHGVVTMDETFVQSIVLYNL